MSEKSEEVVKTQQILGPLSFCNQSSEPLFGKLYPSDIEVPCLFCNETFKFHLQKHAYLAHLYLEHRLIIGDEDQVPILHEYLHHWRDIFENHDFKIFCTKIVMDQLPDGRPSKNEKYFLLCDVSSEDRDLRLKLKNKRLDYVLEQHKFERTDDKYERNCLFCRDVIKCTRKHFIQHLFSKHFLQLGKPENLVFIDELINTVQMKLESLICIFCEKKFKDRPTLKEHMRKKGHKRLNPNNENYDRFFLIHYQKEHQCRKLKKANEKTNGKENIDVNLERDSDSDWSDWQGDEMEVICLFCPHKEKDFTILKDHMNGEHNINFDIEVKDLSFYERVKIVNYIRRKMFIKECVTCNEHFQYRSDLQSHLKQQNHFTLGKSEDWNHPQYFFPTYEDDTLLIFLDEDEEEGSNGPTSST